MRLPRVKSASHEAFGYAAVQAASAWWFEPPRVGGTPAIVRVQIPFKFTDEKESLTPTGGPPRAVP